MSHEILHSVVLKLMQLMEESLSKDFPRVQVLPSELSQSSTWDGSRNAVYIVAHAVTLNEQALRSEAVRETIPDAEGGDPLYRFYRAPLPLTLHLLLIPDSGAVDQNLKLLGRLYQLLHEQPLLGQSLIGQHLIGQSLTEKSAGDAGDTETEPKLTLSPDTRVTQEQLTQLFLASRIAPRLSVPCHIRCLMRSEQIMREARPSRSIRGQVKRS